MYRHGHRNTGTQSELMDRPSKSNLPWWHTRQVSQLVAPQEEHAQGCERLQCLQGRQLVCISVQERQLRQLAQAVEISHAVVLQADKLHMICILHSHKICTNNWSQPELGARHEQGCKPMKLCKSSSEGFSAGLYRGGC